MTTYLKGETIDIEVEVLDDGIAAVLTGATALLGLKQHGKELITKECTITDNIVHTKLTSSDTLTMSGTYIYEVKLTDLDGNIDIVKKDVFKIENSIFVA